MNRPLTQREVDALVLGGGDAAVAAPPVQPFDFARPSRLPRERRVVLEAIHGRFAQHAGTRLGSLLRAQVDVEVRSVERVTFGEAVLSLGAPCAAFVFNPGGGITSPALVDVGLDVAYYLVERMFGGSGEAGRLERPLTALERSVLREVVEDLLDSLAAAWQEHAAIAPAIVSFESDPEMLQIAGRDDDALAVVLELAQAGFRGLVTLIVPLAGLEAVLASRSTAPRAVRAPAATTADRPRVAAGLEKAGLAVSARLPEIRLSARTVAGFAPGQVVRIGLPRDAQVEVQVNGRTRYFASLGQLRKRIALRITSAVAGEGRPAHFTGGGPS